MSTVLRRKATVQIKYRSDAKCEIASFESIGECREADLALNVTFRVSRLGSESLIE